MLRTRSATPSYFILKNSLASILVLLAFAAISTAAPIFYGNFGPVAPTGTTFLNVTESSGTDPTPLFGPPDPFSIGLDFDPTQFTSSASGGALDVTDGQLTFTVVGNNASPIKGISLFEAGDYSLFTPTPPGTAATQALAAAIIRATVTEINGVPVAPISLATSNASVGFNLAANPGLLQPWSLGASLNIAGQLSANQRATKVDITIDNQLVTASQPGTLAFIAKKDFRINIDTDPVPEPAAMLAALVGGGIAIATSRRRRG